MTNFFPLSRIPATIFFADKVAAVLADTEADPTPEIKNTATDHLSSWTPVTASEVEKMIGLAANKTCSLDPALTWLIKRFHHLLAPFIALFVNSPLNSGYVPQKI